MGNLPPKRVTNQKAEMLVSGLTSPSDPSQDIAYTKAHDKVDFHIVSTSDGKARHGSIDKSTPDATCTIQVIDNDFFTGAIIDDLTEICLGGFVLKAGIHFDVGTALANETINNIASNIADAINNMRDFTAVAVTDTVTVTAINQFGSLIDFLKSERATATNLTIVPETGTMSDGLAFDSITLS